MSVTDSELFEDVRDAIFGAHLVAWDGCHKIYLAMDATEADWFRAEYRHVCSAPADEMLAVVGEWWEDSCSLRFVEAVSHNEDDRNAGFVTLIAQFADEEGEG